MVVVYNSQLQLYSQSAASCASRTKRAAAACAQAGGKLLAAAGEAGVMQPYDCASHRKPCHVTRISPCTAHALSGGDVDITRAPPQEPPPIHLPLGTSSAFHSVIDSFTPPLHRNVAAQHNMFLHCELYNAKIKPMTGVCVCVCVCVCARARVCVCLCL